MRNPYASCVIVCESERRPQRNGPFGVLFWLKHFITFQISFAFIWFALFCALEGFPKLLQETLTAPKELLFLPAFCTGVWVFHAILAIAYCKMRRVPVSTTAIIGSSSWLIGMLIFELLRKFLPRKISMSLSWTPIILLLTLYTALSLIAVWVFVRLQSDGLKGTAGNNAMDTKGSVTAR